MVERIMANSGSSPARTSGVFYGPERRPWEETLSPLARSLDGRLLVSPPSADPLALTPDRDREGVTSHRYQVPSVGLSEEQRANAQAETADRILSAVPDWLGFQVNVRCFDHVDCVQPFLRTHISNAGDPFVPSCTRCNTKWMERNVLDYYASLWHAKWPHDPKDPDSYWGYMLTLGSTEGNMYAVWNARDYLSGRYPSAPADTLTGHGPNYHFKQCECPADNPNAFTPVALFSHESHFGIAKSMQAMAVPTLYDLGTRKYPGECPLSGDWPSEVPCVDGDPGPGTIDIQALTTLADFFTAKGHPVIVIFNYGTTFKGAYDDIKAAGKALIPVLKKNGMYERKLYLCGNDPNAYIVRKGFWFHVDGALAAAYAPFLKMAHENGLTDCEPPPVFDFQLSFVSSIVASGHKWMGCPWPCGIYISKTSLCCHPTDQAHLTYFAAPDTTFAGTRNSHSALILWSYISTHPYEAQVKMVLAALETASYATQRLRELEAELGLDLWIMHLPASLAVCFRLPNRSIREKYSLPVASLCVNGEWRHYTHIYVMDGVTKTIVNDFIEALQAPGAFQIDC